MKEHLILGANEQHLETERDQWLAENPNIRVLATGEAKREPPTLLIRLGGKHIPRFSLTIRYEETDQDRIAYAASAGPE